MCDERSAYKLERDHYYQKMEKLTALPNNTTNAEQLKRVGSGLMIITIRIRRSRASPRRSCR